MHRLRRLRGDLSGLLSRNERRPALAAAAPGLHELQSLRRHLSRRRFGNERAGSGVKVQSKRSAIASRLSMFSRDAIAERSLITNCGTTDQIHHFALAATLSAVNVPRRAKDSRRSSPAWKTTRLVSETTLPPWTISARMS